MVGRVLRSVKHEGLDDTAKAQPTETVQAKGIDYMEMFYTRHWLHTTFGYLSPNGCEGKANAFPPQLGGTQWGKRWSARISCKNGLLWKLAFRRIQGNT